MTRFRSIGNGTAWCGGGVERAAGKGRQADLIACWLRDRRRPATIGIDANTPNGTDLTWPTASGGTSRSRCYSASSGFTICVTCTATSLDAIRDDKLQCSPMPHTARWPVPCHRPRSPTGRLSLRPRSRLAGVDRARCRVPVGGRDDGRQRSRTRRRGSRAHQVNAVDAPAHSSRCAGEPITVRQNADHSGGPRRWQHALMA